MASSQIGVVVSLTEANKLLSELGSNAQDLRRVFRSRVAPMLSDDLRQQYATRGSHLGTPWKPLSLATIRGRTRQMRATKTKGVRTTSKVGRAKWGFSYPMVDTARSYKSFTNLTDPEGIRNYAPLAMEWGTRLRYMGPHHTPGSPTGVRYVIPPEEKIPAAVLGHWEDAIVDHILATGGAR